MKASTIVMASEPPVTESVSKLSELDHVPDASIKVIAQHVGIESLADEVARALAPDVEYRLREVIQDACKFMRHSKRTELSTDDINSSLVMRRCEPLYGFPAGAGPIPFHEVPGHPELYIPENKILDLKDILAAKLPRPPIAVNVVPHWLAVEGVQPLIPENPAPRPTSIEPRASTPPSTTGCSDRPSSPETSSPRPARPRSRRSKAVKAVKARSCNPSSRTSSARSSSCTSTASPPS